MLEVFEVLIERIEGTINDTKEQITDGSVLNFEEFAHLRGTYMGLRTGLELVKALQYEVLEPGD